jgi:hypothetical protein
MRKTIQALVTYVVEHCEKLSENKFSGVHFITNYQGTGKDVYRVHKGAFIPATLDADKYIDEEIALVVGRTEFEYDVKWDATSYWLNISK